jgi:hypothetical protein
VLVAAALCPHPPVLVPEVAGGAAPELDELRAACDDVVRALTTADPDVVVVVGNGPRTEELGGDAGGSLRRYGVPLRAGGPAGELPLSLTIGAWLLDRAGAEVPRRYVAIAADEPAEVAARLGAGTVTGEERVALLVMADGSARRTESSPGPFHPDAVAFDGTVAAALVRQDTAALLAIDASVCADLWAGGRVGWQCLAGALVAADNVATGIGRVRYDAAPYGVGYLVMSWD